jgi:hypothetical protein
MSYTEPPIKRKNQSPFRVLVNAWGCLLGLFMLVLGGAVGLLGAIFVAPQLLGFNLTATALAEGQIVLAATAVDLDARARDAESQATNFAFEVQATQAVILNEYELLGQTATQSSNNISATGTAMAEQNLQRQTQIANDYQATQARRQAEAAEIEINFQNTQAALRGITPVPTGQAQAQALTNPYDFTEGLDAIVWELSAVEDWQENDLGFMAARDDAWILEREAQLLPTGNYSLEVRLQHSLQPHSEYWLFLVDDTEGMAVYLRAEGRVFAEAALYSFALTDLQNGQLSVDNATLLSRMTANSNLGEEIIIGLSYDSGWMRLALNGGVLLLVDDAPITHGRVGIQLPVLATLQSMEAR